MRSSEGSLKDAGRPLKVLHVATAFAHEGAPHITPWLTQTLKALKELGVDVRVLTSAHRGVGDGEYEGIPVYRFRYSPAFLENLTYDVAIYERLRLQKWRYLQLPLFMLGGLLKAVRVERDFRPDIVHVHWPIPNAIWALPFGGRRVFTFHNTELSLMKKLGKLGRIFMPLLKRGDFFTFNSSFTRDRFLQIVGNLERPHRIVPLPVGWTPEVRGVNKERGRVLFVGRLVYWKGGDVLIKAASVLKRRGINVKLVFVGDGPARSEWEEMVREYGVEAVFKGWMHGRELSEEYARAWVLVLPSRSNPKVWTESLGLVLVEAMMHGTPVIASRAGGPLDVISEGEDGFFFEVEDYEDLADKLERILRDEDMAKRMGERGRRKAERYLPLSVAREYLKIYLSILRRPA